MGLFARSKDRLRAVLGALGLPQALRTGEPPVVAGVQSKALYLFFDEAGDLNFKASGSSHFFGGVLCVQDPWSLDRALRDRREELFSGSMIPERFHASEDRQAVRDSVFELLAEKEDLRFFVASTEKSEVPPEFREAPRFYAHVANFALRAALEHYPTADPVYVITDQIPVKRKREAVKKGLKASLAAVLGDRRYELAHHTSSAHAGLQAADYLTWAVYRKYAGGDGRSYELIKHLIDSERRIQWHLIK